MAQKLIFKIEEGKLYSAPKPKVDRVNGGDCYFCGEPVHIAEGQLVKHFHGHPTHKKCRKEFQ